MTRRRSGLSAATARSRIACRPRGSSGLSAAATAAAGVARSARRAASARPAAVAAVAGAAALAGVSSLPAAVPARPHVGPSAVVAAGKEQQAPGEESEFFHAPVPSNQRARRTPDSSARKPRRAFLISSGRLGFSRVPRSERRLRSTPRRQ
jgi:hypothetical protein